MPELPEVQTIVDVLIAGGLPGTQIVDAFVRWPKTIATSTPAAFCRQVSGKIVLSIRRRAKYIIFDLSEGYHLVVHLRMTGQLFLSDNSHFEIPHIHVVLKLVNKQSLIFRDTRKFGRFYLVTRLDSIFEKLGPEPLSTSFTAKYLFKILSKRHRQIKPLLLDQTFLSGLGNIYADEALWAAQIHPMQSAHTLTWEKVQVLHRAIRRVLRQGIQNAGTSLGNGKSNFVSPRNEPGRNKNYLMVFRRTGHPCKRCGYRIEKIFVGQRSTHICFQCQIVSDENR